MNQKLFSLFLASLATVGFASTKEKATIGIVNFGNCISESKAGIHEQENMETLRRQMASMMEATEKELKEISAKFDDTEYLDSLSPKAEEELKSKHQSLQEDLARYQQQFYQMLQHANYQMVHKMRAEVGSAAEKVAQAEGLKYVINEDFCFYASPDLDVTKSVIQQMDKQFEEEMAKADQPKIDATAESDR